jgi:hypothetical protein
MAPTDSFKKLHVLDLAVRLGLHPFDVVRILAARGGLPAGLASEPAEVDRLRQAGGIEVWWTGSHPIEDDAVRARGVLRSVARELVQRGIQGDRTTRADNVWRGLEAEDQRTARRALNLLIQERFVRTLATPVGNHVSVIPDQVGAMQRIAAGSDMPASLAALWLA